jgi:ADP-dependent NAD(P)H-hydrate dehydratase / NAD(P)H-hydrate epimerase
MPCLGPDWSDRSKGLWAEAIRALNAQRAPVLAVDIPSGLHADTGQVMGVAVRADLSPSASSDSSRVSSSAPVPSAAARSGSVRSPSRPSSIPCEVAAARRIDWAQQGERFGRRPRTAHKGTFGHLLVIGGAPGLSGAARLAGEAALRAGAGSVTIATHPAHAAWLNLSRPELMVSAVETATDLDPLIERADVVAIGPGLGRETMGPRLWALVSRSGPRMPLVVDADALNLLAETPARGIGLGADAASGRGGTPAGDRCRRDRAGPSIRAFTSCRGATAESPFSRAPGP